MLLSIVIPAYNEAPTIHLILDQLLAVELPAGLKRELVVVNDCSTDGTGEALARYQQAHPEAPLQIAEHAVNRGKGAALRTGFTHASGDFVVVQDADLEYDPREFALLLQPLLENRADVVFGSRFMGGSPHRILFFWHSIGNKALTFASNWMTNLNLTDMETCYKMFRRSLLEHFELCENRFGFEPEFTAKIARVPNVRIYEVGISYYGRTFVEGKKIGWRDGVAALWCIFKYNTFAKGRRQRPNTARA
jgi:glycosyltransferase involved in cell wall biosynthesis